MLTSKTFSKKTTGICNWHHYMKKRSPNSTHDVVSFIYQSFAWLSLVLRSNLSSLGNIMKSGESLSGNRRIKQIQMGKKTLGYKNYTRLVPKSKRGRLRRAKRIFTPEHGRKISKRRFQGQMKIWRKQLHAWDDIHEADVPWRNWCLWSWRRKLYMLILVRCFGLVPILKRNSCMRRFVKRLGCNKWHDLLSSFIIHLFFQGFCIFIVFTSVHSYSINWICVW